MTASFQFCPVCACNLEVLSAGADRGRLACPQDHFIDYQNPAVTAFAFVEHDERYLVLERAHQPYKGCWDLPGGFVEAAETPDEAVSREIFEETGLEVDLLSIVGVYKSRYGDEGKWTVDVAFRCRATLDELNLSDENSEAAWISIEEMPQLAFAGERSALEELRASLAPRTAEAPACLHDIKL